jgi:hypothetical protein
VLWFQNLSVVWLGRLLEEKPSIFLDSSYLIYKKNLELHTKLLPGQHLFVYKTDAGSEQSQWTFPLSVISSPISYLDLGNENVFIFHHMNDKITINWKAFQKKNILISLLQCSHQQIIFLWRMSARLEIQKSSVTSYRLDEKAFNFLQVLILRFWGPRKFSLEIPYFPSIFEV